MVLQENIDRLIKRALNKDQQAYEALVRRFRTGIYNMIYQMVKNREEAEDLVQETFIKAFNSLQSYNKNYAFSTWLYKIAFNNSIDSLRKRKLKTYSLDRPIHLEEGEVHQEIEDESETPESDFLYAEKKKLLQQTINALPKKYRDAIILRHQEERSYEEISQILNIPIGTVKARIFRAREMMKKKLQKKLVR